MNWGTKIIVALSAFIVGIGFMVYICMKQTDIQLVATDYYEQEIAYQGTIDKENNFKALEKKPRFEDNLVENKVKLDFSVLTNHQEISGKISFFRPSQSGLDFQTEINPGEDGIQWIEKTNIKPGKWILKVDWKDQSKEYYNEETIFIQ